MNNSAVGRVEKAVRREGERAAAQNTVLVYIPEQVSEQWPTNNNKPTHGVLHSDDEQEMTAAEE